MDQKSEDIQQQQQTEGGWIKWFCNLEDHHYFCEVDEFFIADRFNLYGLKQQFDHFEEALQMVLSPNTPNEDDLEDEEFMEIYNEASELYGLIHARYIVSPPGLTLMKSKYLIGRFGVCPRVLCERQNVLPIGMSYDLRTSRVKIYCPRCQDVYAPKKRMNDVDGSFFGCSFPHIFLASFPELEPVKSSQNYIPKVFGFKIKHKKGSVFKNHEIIQEEIYFYGEEQIKRLSKQQQEQNLKNNADYEDYDEEKNILPQNILADLDKQ